MATTTFNVRMEQSVKEQLDEIANEIGLSTAAVFNVFARQFIARRGFPFEVVAPEPFKNEAEAADFVTAGLKAAADEAW